MTFWAPVRPLLEALRRALPHKAPKSRNEYWRERARQYGRRAVLHIDHADDEYDAVTRMQEREVFSVIRPLLDGTERTVLDFGCGPGRFTAQLAQMIHGKAVGVDPTARLIALAPAHPDVEYRLLGSDHIPLPDQSIDVVWICLVLGGLDAAATRKALSEVARVLRPDGLLVLVENTTAKPDAQWWHYRSVDEYIADCSFAALTYLHHYVDLGETMSVMAGRKIATQSGTAP